MRKVVFILLILLSNFAKSQVTPITFGDTIRDFFIPSDGKNLSNYSWVKSPAFKVKIWHTRISDSVYRVDQVLFNQGKATTGESKTVLITKSEIKISKVTYFNWLTSDEGEIKHDPPEIWLKMPLKCQYIFWSYTPIKSKENCRSECTYVSVNGVGKRAIKVTNTPVEYGKPLTVGITSDYYVEGIGYWKRQTQDGKDFQILEKQEYDPTYK